MVFEDLLKKKLGNFNDFKRPKKFQAHEKHFQSFISNYHYAIAGRRVFEAIGEEEYGSIFTLFRHMMRSENDNYFNWFSRTFLKVFVVHFMTEAEKLMKEKPEKAIERLKMVVILFSKYVSREDEKMLHINVIFWMNEFLTGYPEQAQQIE